MAEETVLSRGHWPVLYLRNRLGSPKLGKREKEEMANAETLPTPKPCPECGGDRIPADVWGNTALLVSDPTKLLGYQTVRLRAVVCTQCGYTRFYATQPEKLRGKP